MNIWLIKRNGQIYESTQSSNFEIDTDIISGDKSFFDVQDEKIRFDHGDFLFAKEPSGGKITYFGLIVSRENKHIVTNDLVNLLNFEFPATRFSGNSFEHHAKQLIQRYLIDDATKEMNILDIEIGSNTKHIYQPAEPPTPTNLMKYLMGGFKKYNVVWEFIRFDDGIIYTRIVSVKDEIQIKNNVDIFRNWDISTTEVGKGIDNHLYIVNKTTTNSEAPLILAQYWLTTQNEVTDNPKNVLINKPVKSKVVIYDTTEENKLSYFETAEAEIKGSYYSHEISFQVSKSNALVDVETLRIGSLSVLYHEDNVYKSVLTGFSLASDSDLMTLRFGHIRSKLSELLE